MNVLFRTWVIVFIATILFSTVHARDRSYIVDEMTGLGGLFTRGEDVNERGQAVGYSQDTTQVPFAMYWDAGEATVIGAESRVVFITRSASQS